MEVNGTEPVGSTQKIREHFNYSGLGARVDLFIAENQWTYYNVIYVLNHPLHP
jgi:hypothetical protein